MNKCMAKGEHSLNYSKHLCLFLEHISKLLHRLSLLLIISNNGRVEECGPPAVKAGRHVPDTRLQVFYSRDRSTSEST